MIFDGLISLLSWIVYGIALTLPEGTFLPSNFSDLFSDVISFSYAWDWLLPIGTVFSVFSAMLLFMVAELAWRSGKYFIALLRGN